MSATDLNLFLILGPGDSHADDPVSQAAFDHAYQAMKAQIVVHPRIIVRKAVGAESSFIGEFIIPVAQAIGPTLGVVLVAWLQGRAGRKVRMKIGEFEVEAGTTDEVISLLKRAQEFKASVEDKDEGKP